MAIGPILRSLLRNPSGAILIALQLALTLAIVSNAVFIIQQRLDTMARSTGLVEEEVLTARVFYFGKNVDRYAQAQRDIATLEQMAGVKSAVYASSIPLGGSNSTTAICYDSGSDSCPHEASIFRGDIQLLETFGMELVSGRGFKPQELVKSETFATVESSSILVTEALAKAYFPDQPAVGKLLYINEKVATIVGVVKQLLRPANSASGPEGGFAIILPHLRHSAYLALRVEPGAMLDIQQTLAQTLLALNDQRVINYIQPMAKVKEHAYGGDRAMIVLLLGVVGLLAVVTALGIGGLVSFAVASRKKQIGTRRALGASRGDIIRYFIGENLLIATLALGLGACLALLLNHYLMQNYALERLQPSYIFGTILLVLAISQLATLLPALKAASVSPAIATRTV